MAAKTSLMSEGVGMGGAAPALAMTREDEEGTEAWRQGMGVMMGFMAATPGEGVDAEAHGAVRSRVVEGADSEPLIPLAPSMLATFSPPERGEAGESLQSSEPARFVRECAEGPSLTDLLRHS